MGDVLALFYEDGDILKTCCQMFVIFVGFVLLLDAVYIIKSAMKSAM